MTGTETMLARDAFSTSQGAFARRAVHAVRQQPALQHLASSQWGAVRGVLLDHGREPFAALSEHFRNQRAKAEKKGDLRGLAAFDSLGGMLGEIRILASS